MLLLIWSKLKLLHVAFTVCMILISIWLNLSGSFALLNGDEKGDGRDIIFAVSFALG